MHWPNDFIAVGPSDIEFIKEDAKIVEELMNVTLIWAGYYQVIPISFKLIVPSMFSSS